MIEPLEIANMENSVDIEALIESLPVDGIVLTPPLSDNQDIINVLDKLNIPYVPVAPSVAFDSVAVVKMDEIQAAYEMTHYLITLGHARIGFIKGHTEHSAARLRYEGVKRAMYDAGLHVADSLIVQGDFSFRSG